MKRETQFKRCPGSLVFMQPKPDMIPCVACGAETEIWSDEAEGKCPACGATVVRYASQSCVDWCKHAKECLGEDKYKKYGEMKAAMRKHALINGMTQAMTQHFGAAAERIGRAKKVAGYSELILAEEPAADPNVVYAAAVLLTLSDAAAETDRDSAPDRPAGECPAAVPEIIRTLGYADDFIAEVCGIVTGDSRLRDRLNFRIVHDAARLADSEPDRIRAAAAPLDARFLAAFLTDSGRRFAERRVLLGRPDSSPAGGA
ncbi:MAG: FmdB family zinc ribbon protein [Syntrophales bacterium]